MIRQCIEAAWVLDELVFVGDDGFPYQSMLVGTRARDVIDLVLAQHSWRQPLGSQ